MGTKDQEPIFLLETNRIEALSDGVFAIVMTLLILEIGIPSHDAVASGGLLAELLKLWPKFLCYTISFVTLGVYWVAHHLHFYTINRADRGLLWINILFLMGLSLVPFSTALIGEYYQAKIPVIVYGANLTFISLVLYLHWSYATSGGRLIPETTDPGLITRVKHVILIGPAVYLLAMAGAFISTFVSIALYLVVNLAYILPGLHLHLKHEKK